MALINAEWKQRKQFDLDGVQYEVSICDYGNGWFQAAWMCKCCCEEGVLAPIGMTVDEVLLLARIGARVHHRLIHSGTEKINRPNTGHVP